MAKKNAKVQSQAETKSVLARLDDGSIQLTLTIPFATVQKVREEVLKELAAQVEVPGFRKGKVPADRAASQIDTQRLYEHTLQHLLPEFYARAIVEHDLRPVLQPRFELVSVEEDKDWSIRAITCELPDISLGDYKAKVSDLKKADIWTPAKGDPSSSNSSGHGPTREEKEQQIIKSLLETTEVKLPGLLIEEEVNHKLSQLLDQVQKLGLTVEQYLASTGKNIDQLKADYAKQSQESIKLVLILNKVAAEEKVEVSQKEVDDVLKASGEAKTSPEHQTLVKAVLSRRKALDSLVSLA